MFKHWLLCSVRVDTWQVFPGTSVKHQEGFQVSETSLESISEFIFAGLSRGGFETGNMRPRNDGARVSFLFASLHTGFGCKDSSVQSQPLGSVALSICSALVTLKYAWYCTLITVSLLLLLSLQLQNTTLKTLRCSASRT